MEVTTRSSVRGMPFWGSGAMILTRGLTGGPPRDVFFWPGYSVLMAVTVVMFMFRFGVTSVRLHAVFLFFVFVFFSRSDYVRVVFVYVTVFGTTPC